MHCCVRKQKECGKEEPKILANERKTNKRTHTKDSMEEDEKRKNNPMSKGNGPAEKERTRVLMVHCWLAGWL